MINVLNLPRFFIRAVLRGLAGPLLIVMLLAMMVLPLPPFMLDMFFTFNIAFSIMVLLVGMYTVKPLDFAVFPTVLLVTTLLRLSLNIASTRVVLLEGPYRARRGGQGHRIVRPLSWSATTTRSAWWCSSSWSSSISSSSPRAPAASPKSARASPSMRCPASRWRSTPISTPG